MVSKTHKLALLCAALFLPCAVFARQAAPAQGSQAPSPAPPSETLRISAYTKHEDVVLKPADFKALPHITIHVRNEHATSTKPARVYGSPICFRNWERRWDTICAELRLALMSLRPQPTVTLP
jgi:hypothetical protein